MSSGGTSVFVHEQVRAVQELYADVLIGATERTSGEQVRLLTERLAAGHRAGHRGAYVEVRNWHPGVADLDEAAVRALPLGRADFLGIVSRGHGYADPAQAEADATRPSAAFEAAVDAMLGGDLDQLRVALAADPTLARTASHWPHRATLLHYATANGVEIHRQVVPANLPALVELVVQHGADVNAIANAYGTAQRPLGLLLSSGHPHEAGVTPAVAAILRASGAI